MFDAIIHPFADDTAAAAAVAVDSAAANDDSMGVGDIIAFSFVRCCILRCH